MIGIIAALPREVAGLVKGFAPQMEGRARGIFVWRSQRVVVVAAGMGAARAALAVEAAGDVSELWSVGLVGACDPKVRAGSVVEAASVVDVRTGERFATEASGEPGAVVLATGAEIASVCEKTRLFAAYGAAVVDMEAATVARLALAHGTAFRAVKGVSDDADYELEGMGRFETKLGHFNTAGFALHTALRPWTWGRAITLGKHSGAALKALTAELQRRLGA